jgi:1-acyl-sn-glycerol-3-phosphate acyltransferase
VILDRHEPAVSLRNHQSVVDIGAIVLALPVNWNFVAKRELGYIPFFGWAVGIMIQRGQHDRAVASTRRGAEGSGMKRV